ncbi:MAG: hypothetical protein AB7F91_18060, partial [Parvularculaceae bacterium]
YFWSSKHTSLQLLILCENLPKVQYFPPIKANPPISFKQQEGGSAKLDAKNPRNHDVISVKIAAELPIGAAWPPSSRFHPLRCASFHVFKSCVFFTAIAAA